jgi:hypothetical protein
MPNNNFQITGSDHRPGRYYGVGLNNVGSYQMSGMPFISGSINVRESGSGVYEVVRFPRVTKSVTVRNDNADGEVMRLAFTAGGLKDRNPDGEYKRYIKLSGSTSISLDVRCTEVYLMGDTTTNVDADGDQAYSTYATVIAVLTNIYADKSPTYVGVEGIDDLS